MMSRTVVWLIVLVSCAHALAHMYELALPGVEQLIAASYGVEKDTMGRMGTVWRLPLGFGALAAGWVVGLIGAKRMLIVYLVGAATMCFLAHTVLPLSGLFVVMFGMGTFTCIYHPAGLTLISELTTPENRPMALGIHGVFGSLGISSALLVAGMALMMNFTWRQYYWSLAIPGIALAIAFGVFLRKRPSSQRDGEAPSPENNEEEHTDWRSFFTLMIIASLLGFTYTAVTMFLPRYLDKAGLQLDGIPKAAMRNFLTAGVLIIGCVSQFAAGAWARHKLLERQLVIVLMSSAPCLIWMSIAEGYQRAVAAALFALIHFMHQPLYNSLIAKYTPRKRRSLCYGLGFTMGLGVGSIGATFAGMSESDLITYMTLAAVAATGASLGLLLTRWNPVERDAA